MGKSRRNRGGQSHRKDPIAKTVKPPSDPELAALREKSILPVIKNLQSSEPKSRTAAAEAVSNLVSNEKCRKLLLREQIVHIVLNETLTDASLDSRAAGWDILRVLAEEEEADFCIHLYRQDVLSAMGFASQTILENLTKSPAMSKGQLKATWAITEPVVALLSALAEAQDEILEAIVAIEGIKNLLFAIIAYADSPPSICLDALSALLTLSEDNTRLAQDVVADDSPKPLTALLKLQGVPGAKGVLACGVLHNILTTLQWFDGTPDQKSLSDASLIPTLSSALRDAKQESDLPPKSQWSNPTEVLQLALEILADIGTTLQQSMRGDSKKDGEEWNGIGDEDDTAMDEDDKDMEQGSGEEDNAEDDDEDDESMDEDAMQADMDLVTGVDDDDEEEARMDDLPTLRELVQQAVPQLISLATASSQSEDAAQLQAHALSALSNIAWSISVFDFSEDHNAAILKAWTPSGKAIWGKVIVPILAANTADVELATKVTSLAWAVSRSLPGRVPLGGDEHNKFMALYQATKGLAQPNANGTNGDKAKDEEPEDPFQGLGVKCIGVLGQLARDPAPIALNREIGVFLITVVNALPETPAADAVEALNQLFDIYGDEELACDKEVFWKDNFLQHLEAAQPKVKALVKTIDKRTQPELRTRADEVVLNLGRFIQYKKKKQP
ncbi:putative aryl-alcohol dehydrogenase AAD14 [Colletotrichum spaethianum]|uniref:Aryl-alcohol dehydrogenase AAD14 n=1 Tax=Colletotrichum spaethianum TaxID=700344 RepID=A0AA37UPQ5_9PEZI|nr:putative aryl-alcohol dehydrogenase AAD14 [Colletotrichum spaethianum]GKT47477.1 putative aryl-alcohol dehydrogenase AAD14 [Colletotrichum spaethianum]